jgi:hypothetical protein
MCHGQRGLALSRKWLDFKGSSKMMLKTTLQMCKKHLLFLAFCVMAGLTCAIHVDRWLLLSLESNFHLCAAGKTSFRSLCPVGFPLCIDLG